MSTVLPLCKEITENKPWSEVFKKKLILEEDLISWRESYSSSPQKIVSLNGSFDLLHPGHLYIIHQASLMGDVLIVALNSDLSIKQYKSLKRPFIPLEERLQMVAALEFVSFVTFFNETTPCKILEKIRPHIHANGAEYGSECIEKETVEKYGGSISLIPRIPNLSSTNIIERIRNS